NYTQLGLAFTLFSAEVLFNKDEPSSTLLFYLKKKPLSGLSLIYLGQTQEGMAELEDATRQQVTEEHSVIDEAIRDRGKGYTVFSIPVGVFYRPSENKLRNAKTRDFLGKAKLVATENPNEAYTSFTGVTRLRQGVSPQNVFLEPDRDNESSLTRATTLNRLKGPALDVEPVGSLTRAKTTINVAPNARERSATVGADTFQPSSIRDNDPPAATVLNRSHTANATTPVSRMVICDVSPPSISPKPKTSPGAADFYENLVDSYAQPSPPPKPGQSNNDRIANWARNNTSGPALSRAPSAFGGSTRSGTIRRRATRRTVAPSIYDDEEEGYMTSSGEYDELYELTKIRVKIHCEGDVRGMALNPEVSFLEFKQRVAAKFETSLQSIMLKFRDEDGGKVSLRDESDYDLAIETARESAKGRPEGKLELWCEIK
ncbi:hypothetical protein F5888DRAFT_1643648, partial [Russula emetica]